MGRAAHAAANGGTTSSGTAAMTARTSVRARGRRPFGILDKSLRRRFDATARSSPLPRFSQQRARTARPVHVRRPLLDSLWSTTMAATPMDQPTALRCGDRPLHWDRCGRLWLCDRCGASLTYRAWMCGRTLDCGADRLRRPGPLAQRPLRHWKPYS
jgi:hypothetical protein